MAKPVRRTVYSGSICSKCGLGIRFGQNLCLACAYMKTVYVHTLEDAIRLAKADLERINPTKPEPVPEPKPLPKKLRGRPGHTLIPPSPYLSNVPDPWDLY